MNYNFLDIATADIAFEAFGDTLEQTFENSALALEEVVTDTSKIEKNIEKNIEIKSENKKSMLYDFLSELLYLFDTEQLVFNDFDVHIDGNVLKAKLKGDKVSDIRGEIKAITYHGMDIQHKDKWRIQVIVDV